MSTATLIGLASGALTTTAWLPQVIRAFRTRSTKDFAWSWFAMFGVGVGGWLIYGIAAGSPSVIATNALTLALVLGLGSLKLRHTTAGKLHHSTGKLRRTTDTKRDTSLDATTNTSPGLDRTVGSAIDPTADATLDSTADPTPTADRPALRHAPSPDRRKRQNRSPAHISAP
jgi:MtN3 and saliva related transmembrane protein